MKRLRRLAARLGTLYKEMGQTFSDYQRANGLSCPSECGACCLAPTVEASPFEMLPFAIALFDEGIAEKTLQEIEAAPTSQCLFYKKLSFDGTKGRCTAYEVRPTLCRVFGAAARMNAKSAKKELSLCRLLKEQHLDLYQNLSAEDAPVMGHWKNRVNGVAEILSIKDLPINQALKVALEKVLMTSLYSPDDTPEHFEAIS